MERAFCEHCGALIADNAYPFTSEEADIIPLDMIVGSRCLMERKAFNLHAEEIQW
jgi:hypothetical protein